MYERLKCEDADEVDLMIILASTSLHVRVDDEDPGIPGFVKLKADVNSPLRKYTDLRIHNSR